MGTLSQECDDEPVRLGASSFQSGNFHLFLLLFVVQCSVQFFFREIYVDQFLFVVIIAFSSHL